MALVSLCLCSCEEGDAEIMFSTVGNSDPDNMGVYYDSPDPCCIAKFYTVYAGAQSGELILKAKNVNNIYFDDPSEKYHIYYGETPDGQIDHDKLIYEEIGMTVTIIDHRKLKFEFKELSLDPDADYTFLMSGVGVKSNKGGKIRETGITVHRSNR